MEQQMLSAPFSDPLSLSLSQMAPTAAMLFLCYRSWKTDSTSSLPHSCDDHSNGARDCLSLFRLGNFFNGKASFHLRRPWKAAAASREVEEAIAMNAGGRSNDNERFQEAVELSSWSL